MLKDRPQSFDAPQLSSICIMDLPALQTIPFCTGMDWSTASAARPEDEPMLARDRHRDGQRDKSENIMPRCRLCCSYNSRGIQTDYTYM